MKRKLATSDIALAASWRRRRDLNPRAGFSQPTPLAGEPLRPLGYFCIYMIQNNQETIGGESGIRTHGRLRVAGFQDRFLQPLGHLSINGNCPSPEHLKNHTIPGRTLSTVFLQSCLRNFLKKNVFRYCFFIKPVLIYTS